MSTHYEWHDASDVRVDWDKPGAEIGDAPPLYDGEYALLISSNEVSVIKGTVEQIEQVLVQAHNALRNIRHDARYDGGSGRNAG